ncbi:hypothetical protein DFS34DRAFT_295945 [Phlyctochytrium arcticum]|nr:hypothetical protein DFS34DRAFT_295945 [Phlyctochytrium arcticum]
MHCLTQYVPHGCMFLVNKGSFEVSPEEIHPSLHSRLFPQTGHKLHSPIRRTRMPAGSQLPIEIIARMVELARSDRRMRRTLISVCLVSRAFRAATQPHLWAVAADVVPEAKRSAFYTALATNPQLGKFVKSLRIVYSQAVGLDVFQAVANDYDDVE